MKFLFALVGVALAVHSSWPQERLFKSQTEYRFHYESSIASGVALPQSEAAVTRHRSDVTLQLLDDKVALLQLKNIQFANENVELSETPEMIPFERLEKQQLTQEHKTLLELPVRLHFRQGLATDLQFSSEEQVWSANLKRSVINMLQVNWEKISSQKAEEEKFFTVMEKTIEGECEVAYTLTPESGKTWITKSVNFDKCESRMEIAYNQRFASEMPENRQKMIAPQTVYTYKIEKDQLKEVEINSVYSVSLKDQTLMKTKVQARLTLKETSEIRRELEAPKGEKEEIVYNTKYDESIEEFMKKGDESMLNPMSSVPKKVELIREVVEKLAELKDGSVESADYFMRFVQYSRLCSEHELRQVIDKIYKKADRRTQSILENGLAVAGSHNTIKQVLRLAEELSALKTVQILKSIQETSFPSEQIAELLMEFAKTDKCRRQPALKQSVWLAYGAVVRGAIGTPLEKHALPTAEHFKTNAMNVLKKQWEQADFIYEKVLAIKSIANSGLDISIHTLEKIIYDKKQPTVVRMEAIDALRHLTEQMPRKIQKILMPIYSDRLEKNEIRMAALHQLVQAKPALPELSQIVVRMEREPNQHVAAFTYYTLSSLADSELPAHRNVSSIASTLIRNTLYRPEDRFLSSFKRWSVYSQDILSGLNFNMGAIFGKNSAMPKDMMASLETVFGGNWNKYLAQVGVSQQNVEALLNKVLSKLFVFEKKETYSRASRLSKSVSLVKEIARKLNIRIRETTTEEPFAMLYFRYKQMDYAVLPIDEQFVDQMIEKYIRDGSVDMKEFSRLFKSETSEHEFTAAGFLLDSMAKIPTSLGHPMILYQKQPTIFGWNGKTTYERGVLRVQAQPTIGSMHYHAIQIWTPAFVNGIKHIRSVEAATPIDIELELPEGKTNGIEIRQRMPEERKTLLRIESRPVCYVRYFKEQTDRFNNFQEKTVTIPKIEKYMQEKSEQYEFAGLEFGLSGNYYGLWNMENVLLGEQQFELTVAPTRQTPKTIGARLTFDRMWTRGRIEEPSVGKMFKRELATEQGEWETSSKTSRRDQMNQLVGQMNLENGYKHSVQLTLKGQEQTEVELQCECDEKFNFFRFNAEVKPESRRNDWNLKSKTEIIFPRSVSSLEELKEQKHREIQILCENKWGSEEKLEITAQIEQSKPLRNMIKNARQLRGVPAYEQLYRLARLNQIKAHVDYKLSPMTEKIFDKAFELVKGYTYWSSDIESAENEPRRVFVQLSSEPMIAGHYNLTIQTPECSFRAESVRMPSVPASIRTALMPTIARQPKNTLRHSTIEKSECKIEESRIRTFQDAIFRAPMTVCYTVVAKDCSEESRYAVLVKNVKKNSEEKKVKIFYEETEYKMEPVNGELKVFINGKPLRRDSEFEQYKIEKIGEMHVVDLGELVVRFDGYVLKVLLNNGEMDNQCGLCGNVEGENEYKYRTATGEKTNNLEEFHRSFMVDSKECPTEPAQKRNYKEYEYEQKEDDEYNYDYEMPEKKENKRQPFRMNEEYEEESQVESRQPIRKTIVKEQSHRICFSVEPVAQCPRDTIPEKSSDKKIYFACLPRHSFEARQLLKNVRQSETVEVEGLKKSFHETISVARSCIVA